MVPHDTYEIRAKLYLLKCLRSVVGLLMMFRGRTEVVLSPDLFVVAFVLYFKVND
jgi:hypothetical protein